MSVDHIQSHKHGSDDRLAAGVMAVDGEERVFVTARIVTGGFALVLYGYSLAEIQALGAQLQSAAEAEEANYTQMCQRRAEQEGRGEAAVAGA